MSDLVEQVNIAMTAIVAAQAGVEYTELDYILDVEKNSFDRTGKRYGVRPIGGRTASGVTRNYTIDQEFQVILTNEYVNSGVDDVDQRDKTFELYDIMDEIFKAVFYQKMGITNIILNIDNLDLFEPEYLALNNVVVLRASIRVKYRNLINS